VVWHSPRHCAPGRLSSNGASLVHGGRGIPNRLVLARSPDGRFRNIITRGPCRVGRSLQTRRRPTLVSRVADPAARHLPISGTSEGGLVQRFPAACAFWVASRFLNCSVGLAQSLSAASHLRMGWRGCVALSYPSQGKRGCALSLSLSLSLSLTLSAGTDGPHSCYRVGH